MKEKEQGKDISWKIEAKKLKKSKTDAHQSHSVSHRVALQLTKSYSWPLMDKDNLARRLELMTEILIT